MDKQSKLNFRFHDPNDPNTLALALMHICVDANKSRVEQILEEVDCSQGEEKEENAIQKQGERRKE